ncbi:MAG: hypothetical protein KF716_01000 [Anaerolineae bacterium]|nr:hypothetical protein [Anaerolineae bacterium]
MTDNIDKRGKLEEDPFDFQITKDRRILIYRDNALIKVVHGHDAEKLIPTLETSDEELIQLALAKVTGNYKHGNERKRFKGYCES